MSEIETSHITHNKNLPSKFQRWFSTRGWQIYEHQLSMISEFKKGNSCLLIAPTGSGKTLSGFLPSLIELCELPFENKLKPTLHTLYISPLKALSVDVQRNLQIPIIEMDLPILCEPRTSDTTPKKRNRQKVKPPNILLTTPESLELMLAWPEAKNYFFNLSTIIID